MTLQDVDNGLYCMFMNQVEIVEAVVNELEEDMEYYTEMYDNDFEAMIHAVCDNLGYNFYDLSKLNLREIWERIYE